MRKYQQLFLLLISCFSVLVLLMYKSENNRLKYVLKYVNFFGRTDAAIMQRMANGTGIKEYLPVLSKPLPVWQVIGESFHAYSAYWRRNELVAGGEAHAIVVGKKQAVVDFQCMLWIGARSVQGKFRFQRDPKESRIEDTSIKFTTYNFFCQVSRNFGQPEYVTFMDNTSKAKNHNKLRLRSLKAYENKNSDKNNQIARLPATMCVDFVNYNMSSRFALSENSLLQFFLFHQALGIEHFLLYNYDALTDSLVQKLSQTSLHIYALPFNFPFAQTNVTTPQLRYLIETDCLLRNVNLAHLTMVLSPNELFYPSARIDGQLDPARPSFYQQLRHIGTENFRFRLATFDVCYDDQKRLLVDNVHYDPEHEPKSPYRILMYRLDASPSQLQTHTQSVELPLSSGFVHRYVDCQRVGEDGVHDWRKGVRNEFMQFIDDMRSEVDVLI